jgi:S1-C subfamily serine protease
MFRSLAAAALLSATWIAVQAPAVLHITVRVPDAQGKPTPVPHHALLVSDNPPTAAPRRVVTGLDGTVDVRLRAGSYTIESDKPVAFGGKTWQWTQVVDMARGDQTLELTAGNADAPDASSNASATSMEADPSWLLIQWQDSVVALWTPTTHATGFIVGEGLLATNQRGVGAATSVEVQLTPSVKVAADVLESDAKRDVVILRVHPDAVAGLRPLPLGCADSSKPALGRGQEILTIAVPLRQGKGVSSGTVTRVEAGVVESDVTVSRGGAGGPVFVTGGKVAGLSSSLEEEDTGRTSTYSRVVKATDVCDVLGAAVKKTAATPPPAATHLPLEPTVPFPVEALKDAAQHRAGSLTPYQMSSADFDIAFITPVMTYGVEYQLEQVRRGGRERTRVPESPYTRPLMDFSNWSDYVAEFPPVLLVRVTPRLVEGFWTKVGRAAASTQGVSLPPIKHVTSGFLRMRAFCGDTELTPIHPFKLEQRVSETDAIYEGLYVFDPAALRPECGVVKIVVFSEKEPEKADTRVVDPKLLEQIWSDFAPYRAAR